ncbi:MAG: hypothetical protein EHM46_05690 [Bacteroidetes bacterium]|nr:MAG: hypothetical protein EHM46_05690 [Bacteroidota bacterium]
MKPDRHIIRKLGYPGDQEGIINRYLREGDGWKGHLENTRNFILESFAGSSVGTVAILGSGWLLDIPLEGLRNRFSRILLADIRHPAQIRRKVEGMKNVELVETDLTGGAMEFIWRATGRRQRLSVEEILDNMELSPPEEADGSDFLVSANLLDQLELFLYDYMCRKGYFQHETSDAFRAAIQRSHLAWITSRPGCLVTDIREINRDHKGRETVKELIFNELPSGFRTRMWNWDFDTHGTYQAGCQTVMEVRAIEWA